MPTSDVLMPVRNHLPYPRDAVDGVRHQAFTDGRMFALDHGSTDDSLAHQFAQAGRRVVVFECSTELAFSGPPDAGPDLAGTCRQHTVQESAAPHPSATPMRAVGQVGNPSITGVQHDSRIRHE